MKFKRIPSSFTTNLKIEYTTFVSSKLYEVGQRHNTGKYKMNIIIELFHSTLVVNPFNTFFNT